MPILILGALIQTACASERILDVRANIEVSRAELIGRIAQVDELIVGEKHNTKVIQDSEASLFRDYALSRGEPVTFAWEFWDWSDKAKLDQGYADFLSGKSSADDFLKLIFGTKNSNLTYAPLLEEAKKAGALILPTNLSRAEKAPVLTGGLAALDPKLLPPGFQLGGTAYYDRFIEAMGGHGDPAKLPNYFAAQCLVDDSVAFHLSKDLKTRSVFLVIGDFHSSYFDGVWQRSEKRSAGRSRLLIQIAETGDQTDWEPVLHHTKYGELADYVIFSN